MHTSNSCEDEKDSTHGGAIVEALEAVAAQCVIETDSAIAIATAADLHESANAIAGKRKRTIPKDIAGHKDTRAMNVTNTKGLSPDLVAFGVPVDQPGETAPGAHALAGPGLLHSSECDATSTPEAAAEVFRREYSVLDAVLVGLEQEIRRSDSPYCCILGLAVVTELEDIEIQAVPIPSNFSNTQTFCSTHQIFALIIDFGVAVAIMHNANLSK